VDRTIKIAIAALIAVTVFGMAGAAQAAGCARCLLPTFGHYLKCQRGYESGGATCIIMSENNGDNCFTTGDCEGQMCGVEDDDPEPNYCEERINPSPARFAVLAAPAGDGFVARLLGGFVLSRVVLKPGPISGIITWADGRPAVPYKGRLSIEGMVPSLMLTLDLSVAGQPMRIETWARGRAGRVETAGLITQEW